MLSDMESGEETEAKEEAEKGEGKKVDGLGLSRDAYRLN